MLSTTHDFLFVHVPKTGGNSIQAVLSEFSDDEIVAPLEHQDGVERFGVAHERYGYSKHSPLRVYRSELPEEVYSRLFKFAVLRDPWERMISLYFSPHRGSVEWDRDAFEELVDEVPAVRDFVRERSLRAEIASRLDRIGLPWPRALYGSLDRDLDALLRFEKLSEDFERVCRRIGIDADPLPRRNQSDRNHYARYYDAELIERVRSKFSDEIEYGGYEPPEPSTVRA